MKYLLILLMTISSIFAATQTSKALYIQECASCHMAYQAEFLPKRSWVKLMDNLSNHFKTDASLEQADLDKIKNYLVSNASDSKRSYGEMAEFANSISKNSTPIAISEIPKFKREHRKIPERFVTQKEVRTFANCTACHTDATQGTYRERNIKIPNYGRWDD
jgi:nitrate/TMAO reductase-like tetraheme cytochrome c subunit